jgi:hypothetical protein
LGEEIALHTYQRTLAEAEIKSVKSKLPWFGRRRQDVLTEIERRVIHVYEFDVVRSWNINGCRPPCCPYTYLFQTADHLYVYVETWHEFDLEQSANNESRLVIESTPTSRMLVKSTLAGTIGLDHDEKLREFNEFFEIDGNAEWRVWKKDEIPSNVRELLEAVSLSSKL